MLLHDMTECKVLSMARMSDDEHTWGDRLRRTPRGCCIGSGVQAAARLALRAPFSSITSSRIPTRTSPHLPIPAPQRAHVTRLLLVTWSGTANLLLPHLGHLSGVSGMARAPLCSRIGGSQGRRCAGAVVQKPCAGLGILSGVAGPATQLRRPKSSERRPYQIGFGRLRLRRLKFVREPFFLAAVAQNIKRLVASAVAKPTALVHRPHR
jgi:hypothetical protein